MVKQFLVFEPTVVNCVTTCKPAGSLLGMAFPCCEIVEELQVIPILLAAVQLKLADKP